MQRRARINIHRRNVIRRAVVITIRETIKGGDHCLGPKWKGAFGNLFQPNNASKSIYCVV